MVISYGDECTVVSGSVLSYLSVIMRDYYSPRNHHTWMRPLLYCVWPCLRYLELESCGLNNDNSYNEGVNVDNIGTMQSVECLKLDRNPLSNLRFVLEKFPNIRHLSVVECSVLIDFSDIIEEELVFRPRHLEVFNISGTGRRRYFFTTSNSRYMNSSVAEAIRNDGHLKILINLPFEVRVCNVELKPYESSGGDDGDGGSEGDYGDGDGDGDGDGSGDGASDGDGDGGRGDYGDGNSHGDDDDDDDDDDDQEGETLGSNDSYEDQIHVRGSMFTVWQPYGDGPSVVTVSCSDESFCDELDGGYVRQLPRSNIAGGTGGLLHVHPSTFPLFVDRKRKRLPIEDSIYDA